MWDIQLSDWMIGFAGSGAIVVAIIIMAMFAYLVSQRLIAIRDNQTTKNKKHYLALVGIFIVFTHVMSIMFSFEPNVQLQRIEIRPATPPIAD